MGHPGHPGITAEGFQTRSAQFPPGSDAMGQPRPSGADSSEQEALDELLGELTCCVILK